MKDIVCCLTLFSSSKCVKRFIDNCVRNANRLTTALAPAPFTTALLLALPFPAYSCFKWATATEFSEIVNDYNQHKASVTTITELQTCSLYRTYTYIHALMIFNSPRPIIKIQRNIENGNWHAIFCWGTSRTTSQLTDPIIFLFYLFLSRLEVPRLNCQKRKFYNTFHAMQMPLSSCTLTSAYQLLPTIFRIIVYCMHIIMGQLSDANQSVNKSN